VKVWVYKGEVVSRAANEDKIAAEAALATGGRARGQRSASVKSRAEQAAEGEQRQPRLIEAGGGKRLVEAGADEKPGRRLIEAGGGKRRVDADDAEAEYKAERMAVATDESVVDAALPEPVEIDEIEAEGVEIVKADEDSPAEAAMSETPEAAADGATDEAEADDAGGEEE
jgi:hypothetical protein